MIHSRDDWASSSIYILYTIVHRRIKGGACGHICMGYTPTVATTASIFLSQGCTGIFWQLVVDWVYIAAQLRNLQLQHREMENLFLQWKDHFPPVLTRRATTNTIEPIPPPVLYSVLTVLPRHNSQNVSQIFLVIRAVTQCLLGVLNHAWVDRRYCFPTASYYPDGWRR